MTAPLSWNRFLRDNAPWLSAGVLLTLLSSFGQTFFISIFAAEIQADFSLSHGEWGGIYSLGTTASAAVMLWAGGLTDRFRVRTLGQVVLIALAGACLFMAVNPYVALLPFVIFALRLTGQGMASHIAIVAMSRWFTATRGRALSIATLGFSVGEALFPLLFVALLAFFDWRFLWGVIALVALFGVPILTRLLRHERTPASLLEASANPGMEDRHWTRLQAVRHPLFWFMVPALLGPSAFGTAFFFHQVHFSEIKDITHLSLVSIFPIYTVSATIAMIGAGLALDRFGTARLIPFYQLPMVAAFILFTLSGSYFGLILGFIAFALTTGGNATLPNAFWAEFYGTANLGSIKALATAVMVLGSAIGPGVTGVLIDIGVGLEAQYLGVALYFLFASASMYVGITRYRARRR